VFYIVTFGRGGTVIELKPTDRNSQEHEETNSYTTTKYPVSRLRYYNTAKNRRVYDIHKTLTRSCATADGPRDALSVKILSTAETSCTTNPQKIEVMELEGYS